MGSGCRGPPGPPRDSGGLPFGQSSGRRSEFCRGTGLAIELVVVSEVMRSKALPSAHTHASCQYPGRPGEGSVWPSLDPLAQSPGRVGTLSHKAASVSSSGLVFTGVPVRPVPEPLSWCPGVGARAPAPHVRCADRSWPQRVGMSVSQPGPGHMNSTTHRGVPDAGGRYRAGRGGPAPRPEHKQGGHHGGDVLGCFCSLTSDKAGQ